MQILTKLLSCVLVYLFSQIVRQECASDIGVELQLSLGPFLFGHEQLLGMHVLSEFFGIISEYPLPLGWNWLSVESGCILNILHVLE